MNDKADVRIVDAARKYRASDTTPRDAIWEQVAAARNLERPAAATRGARIPTFTSARVAAAIALLLIGAGVGIVGNETLRPRADVAQKNTSFVKSELLAYLASSDSLLRAFRSNATTADSGMQADLESWARQLIARTRTLEGSALSADSGLRQLLVDLDLVLVQIAQYATMPAPNRSEVVLINDAIKTRSVEGKLRIAERRVRSGAMEGL